MPDSPKSLLQNAATVCVGGPILSLGPGYKANDTNDLLQKSQVHICSEPSQFPS